MERNAKMLLAINWPCCSLSLLVAMDIGVVPMVILKGVRNGARDCRVLPNLFLKRGHQNPVIFIRSLPVWWHPQEIIGTSNSYR